VTRPEPRAATATILGLALTLFWIGLLVGVSFLATPAKFLAPSLSLPVALDVGRYTFGLLSKLEWLLTGALLTLLLFQPRSGVAITSGVVLALLVVLEAAWLLPVLDQRVELILAGQQPPASKFHDIFIGIEIVKLLALGVIAFAMGRQLGRQLYLNRHEHAGFDVISGRVPAAARAVPQNHQA